MSEDPEQDSHEDLEEGESHEAESDLIHAELGEVLASARVPMASAKSKRSKPNAQGASTLGFLHLQNLPSDKGSGNGPIAIWIILQLAAIAASAGRWKFWATEGIGNAPSIELLTLHLLLIVQIAVSTLIYPILLDRWSKLAWTLATAVAFGAIGWVLTGDPPLCALWAGGLVVLWIIGLSAWRAAVRSTPGTMLIRLMLALIVLGWPILMYLHGEFATGSSGATVWNLGGPLVAGVRQLEQPRLQTPTWAILAAFIGLGGVVLLARLVAAALQRRRLGSSVQPH